MTPLFPLRNKSVHYLVKLNYFTRVACQFCVQNLHFNIYVFNSPYYRDGLAIVWKIPQEQQQEADSTLPSRPQKVYSAIASEKSATAVCFMTNTKFAVGSDEGSVTMWQIEAPLSVSKAWRVK